MSVHIPSTIAGKPPFWGVSTSVMNFCEDDYHFTSYVGEFINTVTSFAYVLLGGYALYQQARPSSRAVWSHGLPYVALIIVGIGSALFHATLKYRLQLVDDLSMLLGAGIMFHHVTTTDNSSLRFQLGVAAATTGALLLAVFAHVYTGDSALHQVVFGAMVVTVATRLVKLSRTRVRDQVLGAKLRVLIWAGDGILLLAYALWLVDVFFCPHLRSVRILVGVPAGWIFELHGWWHIFTGLGVYFAMVVGEFFHEQHRHIVLRPDDGYLTLLRGPGTFHVRELQKEKGKEKGA